VVGVSGCGKSRAAARIAARIGVEPVGIDRIQWRDGWTKAPPKVVHAAIRDVIARESWVFEGNLLDGECADDVAGRADVVVWLD